MKISICIPSYNRPDYLKETILSCLNQTLLPFEILIGDDSTSCEASKKIVQNQKDETLVKIRYFHNSPPLKQANNVNNLFQLVESEFLVLLHDDDLLLPNALEELSNCIVNDPKADVVFGKQFVISESGEVDLKASESLNTNFFRSSSFEGSILTSLEAGFLQQFPNDGFLIKSEVANKIKYDESARDACDFDFGLRVGKGGYRIYFVNKYLSKYRISNQAVSTSFNNNAGIFSFLSVEKLDVPKKTYVYKSKWLKEKASIAVLQALNLKNQPLAFKIYFGKWHRNKIFTLGGIKRLLIILFYKPRSIK